MSELVKLLKKSRILCLCEGGAETAIINILLDHDCLVFSRDDLVYEKVHPRMSVKDIERKFLNKSYQDKPLVILRIIDSKNEKFNLSKIYKDRFEIEKCLTKPEIEILIIIDNDKLKQYRKVKTKIKPSDFCKSDLGFKNVKSKHFMNEYFDLQRLLSALKIYKSVSKNDHFAIEDIFKK